MNFEVLAALLLERRQMKMKRIILLVLSITILLSLASCSKAGTSQNVDNSQNIPDSAITDNEQQGNTTLEEKLELPSPLTVDNKDEFIEIAEQLEDKHVYDYYGSFFNWLYIDNTLIIYADELKQPDIKNPELPWGSFKQDIKEIIIADGCKSIDGKIALFSEAESLETIILPDGITNTPNIIDSINLKYINIPDTVTDLGRFRGCTSLQTIDIPEGIKDFNGTFEGCTSLETITLPDSTENLNETFINCKSLKQINLPNNIKTLGDYTFKGCENLEEVIIPEGISKLGLGLFQGCNLVTLRIPSTLKEINVATFSECTIQNIISDSENFIMDNGVLINQTEIEYYDTDIILTRVVKAQAGIQEYDVPGDVFESCQYAFYGCTNLKSITIPKLINRMGTSTFEKCTSLVDVEIKTDSRFDYLMNNLEKKYGYYIFKDCTSLKEIPILITQTNAETYYGCTGIDRVDITSLHNMLSIINQFDEANDHTDFYIHWNSRNGTKQFEAAYYPYVDDVNTALKKHSGHIYLYDDSLNESTLCVIMH